MRPRSGETRPSRPGLFGSLSQRPNQQTQERKMAHHAATSLIELLEGVQDFSTEVFPKNREMFAELARGQSPHTLFITCADSRVSPGLITQNRPGNLFVLRNIGNIVPAYGEMLGGVSA